VSAPERLTSGNNPVATQVEEPKPSWWRSFIAQLTGRTLDRAVEVDEVDQDEAVDTESTEPDTTDTIADDDAPVGEPLEAELVDEIPAPAEPEVRPADETELEVLDAELVEDPPTVAAVPEVAATPVVEIPDVVHVPEVEEVEPEPAAAVVEVPELDVAPSTVVEEPEVEEPVTVVEAPTPELEATDPEPPEPEVADQEPTATVYVGVEVIPCDDTRAPSGPVKDRDDLTERWVDELRNGGHRQAHGTWEDRGVFGGKSECTLQVAINTYDIPLGELRDKYGDRFIGEVLTRNDIELQSFDQIADYIERTQLSRSRRKEMEMER
jgi:hypothetical protein